VVPLNILWVPVTYPGNSADSPANCYGGNCGSVAHGYDISQYQITNTQYAAFLNARAASDPLGLYNANMGSDPDNGGISQYGTSGSFAYSVKSGFENKPVNYVSFYSALRFANWVNNGAWDQNGTIGDTESGAYTLLGGTPIPTNATSITRNPSAKVALPSENEWYKAAYYSPSGVYFAYPFGTNSEPTCAAPTATPNTANCNEIMELATDVGSYTGSRSPFGSFDQGGNVEEWTEGIAPGTFNTVVRGAAWADPPGDMAAAFLLSRPPSSSLNTLGFRVVQPPPAASCGLGSELSLLLPPLLWLRRWRVRKRA
jgi:formylglycine-generating enzyme required for sulfatase activity